MAEESKYINKKKKPKPGPQRAAEGRQRKSNMIVLTDDNLNKMLGKPEIGKDIVIIAPGMKTKPRNNFKRGGPVCKLATKGKGRAYGKNS